MFFRGVCKFWCLYLRCFIQYRCLGGIMCWLWQQLMQNCCIIALLSHTISALSNIPVLASFLRVAFFFFSGYVHVQRFSSSHAETYIRVLSFDLWTNKCTLHFHCLLCSTFDSVTLLGFPAARLILNWNAIPSLTANEMFISIIGAVFLDPQVRSIVLPTYYESERTYECLHDCVS